MPLVDVSGNEGGADFLHRGPIFAKVGITSGTTEIVRGAVVAHWPAFGVNKYVAGPTVADENAGDQVPVMPSIDFEGKGFAEFWQTEPIEAKVGVIGLVIIIVLLIGFEHPAIGVKI
jgi:hypothetical protein